MCDYVHILGNKHMKGPKQPRVTHPSVFLLTSSFSMSSWLPFPSGLISLCIFSHHSGGHRIHSAAFIPHWDSPTPLLSSLLLHLPLHVHLIFSLGLNFRRRCHIHKNCDFQSLESRRSLNGLLSWLSDPFTLSCSTCRWPLLFEMREWRKLMERRIAKQDMPTNSNCKYVTCRTLVRVLGDSLEAKAQIL